MVSPVVRDTLKSQIYYMNGAKGGPESFAHNRKLVIREIPYTMA